MRMDALGAPLSATGQYFDGLSARPHPVTLRLAQGLSLEGSGIARDWHLLDLRAAPTEPPLMRVGPVGDAARVEFSDAALAAALVARCPDLDRRDGEGGTARLVLWSIAAGAALLLATIFGMPILARFVVPLVPDFAEARLGAAVEAQAIRLLGNPKVCGEQAGRAVLDRLVARLSAPDPAMPAGLQVAVLRHATANALTLPGARILVLSDLIAKARTPDEFAAVLAHELGHAAARDPTRALIQASGTAFVLSLVLGDLTGSTVIVGLGQAALQAGYTREAERAADAYAVEAMARAGGNGAALADILERIAADEPDSLAFLRSHPFTRERAAAIRARAGPEAAARRILGPVDWAALSDICASAPQVQPIRFLRHGSPPGPADILQQHAYPRL